MTRPQPRPRTRVAGWELADLGLALLAAALASGCVFWAGAAAAAVVTGHGIPEGGILPALTALTALGDPASQWPHPEQLPPAAPYWAGTAVVITLAAATALAALLLWRRWLDSGPDTSAARFARLPGLAARRGLVATAGERHVRDRATHARPTLKAGAAMHDLGYRIGRAHGRDLWCSVEDSALLLGPPRMGKGLHIGRS